MATTSSKESTGHGADVAKALGWPGDRVGFVGALGGLIDVGASPRRPRSFAGLLMLRRVQDWLTIQNRCAEATRQIEALVREERQRGSHRPPANQLAPEVFKKLDYQQHTARHLQKYDSLLSGVKVRPLADTELEAALRKVESALKAHGARTAATQHLMAVAQARYKEKLSGLDADLNTCDPHVRDS